MWKQNLLPTRRARTQNTKTYSSALRVVEFMVVFGDAPPGRSFQSSRKHKFLTCDKFLLKFPEITNIPH